MTNDSHVAVLRDNGRRIIVVAEFLQRRAARTRANETDAARGPVLRAAWKCGEDGKLAIGWRSERNEPATAPLSLEAAG
jgi:hypothetical protein